MITGGVHELRQKRNYGAAIKYLTIIARGTRDAGGCERRYRSIRWHTFETTTGVSWRGGYIEPISWTVQNLHPSPETRAPTFNQRGIQLVKRGC